MEKFFPLSVFSVLVFLSLSCSTGKEATTEERPSIKPSGAQEAIDTNWVEATLKRLSLEEKVAQMVMPKGFGVYVSEESEEYQRFVRLLKERRIGGFIFSIGEVYETALLINKLQALSDVPLLIAADFERGVAMRIRRSTVFPEIMGLAATRNPMLAYKMGKIIAQEGRALGVHQNFAPVVDVNVNPDNPVINVRSFGENPALVGEMAAAFIQGMHDGRMISTAKHFPGHGDTGIDSHISLPTIPYDRARLDSIELPAFKYVIDKGVMSIMVGHLLLSAIDTVEKKPATLSKTITTELLRKELGFNGLVVTDALDMGALTTGYSVAEIAVLAAKSGSDVLLVPVDDDATIDAIIYAVRRGEIPIEQIDQSVKRILSVKQWLGLVKNRFVDVEKIPLLVGTTEHHLVAKTIARNSITFLKNEDNVLPLQKFSEKKIASVVVSDLDEYRTEVHRSNAPWPNESVGSYLNAQLRKRYSNLAFYRVDPRSNVVDFDSIATQVKKADIILCAAYVKLRAGSGKIQLPPHLNEFVARLTTLGKPVVLVSFGNPYIVRAFPNVSAYVCAYSDFEVSVESAVEVLFGETPVRGKLPVSIPGLYAYGSGLEFPKVALREGLSEEVGFDGKKLNALDDIIKTAIKDTAFPAAQVLVAKDGIIVHHKAYGTYDYSPYSRQIDLGTMFDLASLTKVIATTNAVMKLYDERKIDLDNPVMKYLPKFGQNGKEKITIRNLLLHDSGLPAWKKFYETCKTANQMLDSLYASELIYPTGDSTVYSDLGIITLGKVVEKITKMPLDKYVAKEFFHPLGMMNTMYNPTETLWNKIAPTEIDTAWRKLKAPVRGQVHDENAALLGGVSGHAGLFSTASDLAIIMQMLMNGGTYGGKLYLKEETVNMFTARQSAKSTRALGWDTKNAQGYSSAGTLFSEHSFGHTGFTGTSIWADPARNLFVIFLANRVYPTRANTKIFRVRPAVHDAVIQALNEPHASQ